MAKDKKEKTETKCKVGKEKVAKKIARKFGKKVVATAAVALLLCGCSTSGSQPAKSQTANFDSCVFNITLPQTAKADGVTLEIGTQAQYLESNGTESYAPTATPTTTASPTTTLSVPSGALGIGGAVGELSAAAVKGVAKGVSAVCEDGECADGACEDN